MVLLPFAVLFKIDHPQSNMEKEKLQTLFKKYHEGKCTEEEKALLEAWYLQFNEQELDITAQRIKAIGKRIYRELPGNDASFIKIGTTLAAAAVTIGILFTVALNVLTPATAPVVAKAADVPPGKDKAILTLSNGRKIVLDNSANGQLTTQSGSNILKTRDGQIAYADAGKTEPNLSSSFNNITTPNGGQWQVILPDGSKVWLNSSSSLDYPATFKNHKERIVQLKGEAYFEVAKDRQHPFIVKSDKQTVSVLGTHFNINAYDNEASVKTTLEEGKIKIANIRGTEKILIPGQQATLTGSQLKITEADLVEALAWKNGYFRFNDENIQSIMRQLARWYDIDVQYKNDTPTDGLNGKISRYKNISQVLKALEATKIVHFKIEGRRVTVMK
jgi:transmembrane sensor